MVVDQYRKSPHAGHARWRSRLPATDLSPEDHAIAIEQERSLHAALDELPARERQVVELRLAGLTGAEIGKVLGCRTGAVGIAQFRAVRKLRALLWLTKLRWKDPEMFSRWRAQRAGGSFPHAVLGWIRDWCSVPGARGRPRCDDEKHRSGDPPALYGPAGRSGVLRHLLNQLTASYVGALIQQSDPLHAVATAQFGKWPSTAFSSGEARAAAPSQLRPSGLRCRGGHPARSRRAARGVRGAQLAVKMRTSARFRRWSKEPKRDPHPRTREPDPVREGIRCRRAARDRRRFLHLGQIFSGAWIGPRVSQRVRGSQIAISFVESGIVHVLAEGRWRSAALLARPKQSLVA